MPVFVFKTRNSDLSVSSHDFESAVYQAAKLSFTDSDLENMLSSRGVVELLAEMGVVVVTCDNEVIVEL